MMGNREQVSCRIEVGRDRREFPRRKVRHKSNEAAPEQRVIAWVRGRGPVQLPKNFGGSLTEALRAQGINGIRQTKSEKGAPAGRQRLTRPPDVNGRDVSVMHRASIGGVL